MVVRLLLLVPLLAALADTTACVPASAAPSAAAASSAPVGKTWRLKPGELILGTNHAHIHSRGHGYGSDPSARQLDLLQKEGANFVALTAFAFQRSVTSDGLVGYGPDAISGNLLRDRSMNDDDVRREVGNAHQRGLRVALKPHLWAGDFGSGEWHGTIRQNSPAEHARWWASYCAYILSQATLAQAVQADMLVLGTEMVKMTSDVDAVKARAIDAEWRGLIKDVRAVFGGSLSYAAHWDKEAFAITFWDALDAIGISAYFPLDVPDGASVDELARAWEPYKEKLAKLAAAHPEQPLVFLELGFRAVTGTHRTPWATDGGVADNDAQARAYEATARAFAHVPWWRGALLWKSFTDPSLADEGGDSTSYSFIDRPAGAVIRQWFRR